MVKTLKTIALYLSVVGVYILIAFFFPSISFADTQVFPTITSSGNVTLSAPESGNFQNIRTYSGIYPSGSLVSTACSLACGSSIFNGSNSMEGGFANGAASTPDGMYYVTFTAVSSGNNYYWQASRINNNWGESIDLISRIIINSPTSTTASTTFDIDFTYFLNSNDDPENEFSHILFQLCAQSYPNDPCERFSFSPTTLDTVVSQTLEVTTNREGYYLLIGNFWNGVETATDCFWWNFTCQETAPKLGIGTSVRFNVATTSIDADVPDWILNQDICGGFTGIIDSSLCNGIAFLFMPSQDSFTRLTDLQSFISSKQPWGFFALANQKLDEIVNNASSSIGTDVIVDVAALGGSTTIFSWTGSKNTMENLGFYNSDVTDILITFVWFMLIGWFWGLFFKTDPVIANSENYKI